MRLDSLLVNLAGKVDSFSLTGDPSKVVITGISYDSREVSPGDLFCCIPGALDDGHVHAGQAVERGAVSVLYERDLPRELLGSALAGKAPIASSVFGPSCSTEDWVSTEGIGDPVMGEAVGKPGLVGVRVPAGQVRQAMAWLSAAFWGQPSKLLKVAGVTGTNGKTTVTHLLAAILRAHRWPAGVVGTLGGARTTPEAPVLQKLLYELAYSGRRAAALEVSSHALDQHRVDGVHFEVVGFTNLSHDHLDYHKTMERYFQAKASLFTPDRARHGVICVDDIWGERLAEMALANGLSVTEVSASDAGEVLAGARSSRFTWMGREVVLGLGGRHNVINAMVAAAMAIQMGATLDEVVTGLESVKTLPGRFEVVAVSPVTVVVDYAHTPAGLSSLLRSARQLCSGRLLIVFGAGGDRDRDKRPEMGKLAAQMADVVIVTSDNPRSEDPASIIDQVLAGAQRAQGTATVVSEPDRAAAIGAALTLARSGDMVVIAGKGHERVQETGQGPVPFDDREVVRSMLGLCTTDGASEAAGGRQEDAPA